MYLDCTTIDLGYVPTMAMNDTRTVTIYNRTHGLVTVAWDADRRSASVQPSEAQPFRFTPSKMDIPANGSATFTLIFQAPQSDQLYSRELSAFVFFKNQRSFRLVNDATLTAPWHLLVRAFAHTFSSVPFIAQIRIDLPHAKLTFPGLLHQILCFHV